MVAAFNVPLPADTDHQHNQHDHLQQQLTPPVAVFEAEAALGSAEAFATASFPRGGATAAASAAAAAAVRAVVADLAVRCGIPPELLLLPAAALSGGTQRKLSLAIALLGQPALLLLDEPSAGMDPAARRAMCDTINMALRGGGSSSSPATAAGAAGMGRWNGGGSAAALVPLLLMQPPAVVLTTHYGEEALALCDVVGVMEAGRLLALGRPGAALRALPAGHYLAEPEEWGGVLPEL